MHATRLLLVTGFVFTSMSAQAQTAPQGYAPAPGYAAPQMAASTAYGYPYQAAPVPQAVPARQPAPGQGVPMVEEPKKIDIMQMNSF